MSFEYRTGDAVTTGDKGADSAAAKPPLREPLRFFDVQNLPVASPH
jgi:hypothetical protein